MGFLDSTIGNVQRVVGDIGTIPLAASSALVGGAVATSGNVLQTVGVDTGFGGGMQGPAGPPGVSGNPAPFNPEGATIIQVNPNPVGQLNLDVAFGGHWSGGNGQFATRTRVERLNVLTGEVSVVSLRPGSPHLMNSEVNAAKKLFRQVAALNKRMPRKTVKQSKMAKLTEAAVDAATRQVTTGGHTQIECNS